MTHFFLSCNLIEAETLEFSILKNLIHNFTKVEFCFISQLSLPQFFFNHQKAPLQCLTYLPMIFSLFQLAVKPAGGTKNIAKIAKFSLYLFIRFFL